MIANVDGVSPEYGNKLRRKSQQFSFLSEQNLSFRRYYVDMCSLLVCSSDHESIMSRNMGFVSDKTQ